MSIKENCKETALICFFNLKKLKKKIVNPSN